MRTLLLLALALLQVLLLAGKGGVHANYREIEQLLVIQTMGLDDTGAGVTLSLAAAGDSERGPRRLRAEGMTISGAMEHIYRYSFEEELFCAHVDRLLIGEKAAENGLESTLAYLTRAPEMRLDMPLYIVRDGTALDTLMNAGGSKGICEVMDTVELSAKRRGDSGVTTAAGVLRDSARFGSALVCALSCDRASELEGPPDGSGGESDSLSVAPAGYAILREGRLCRYLTPEQSVAAGLLKNETGLCELELRDGRGATAVLEITGGGSSLQPVWDGPGQLRGLRIGAEVRATLAEVRGRPGPQDAAYADGLTARLEARLSELLTETMQASRDLKADFLGLAAQVERASPGAFRQLDRAFPELLPELELEISVSARLSHTNDRRES